MTRQVHGVRVVAVLVGLFVLGQAASVADPVKPVTEERTETLTVQGTLTDARCYFNTGAVGGKHEYCAFMSMKADLPVGVLTAKNEFVYLVIEPKRLANYATRTIRVEGQARSGGRLLKPDKIWVKTDSSSWTLIAD